MNTDINIGFQYNLHGRQLVHPFAFSESARAQVGFAVIMTGIACWSHMKIKEQQDLGLV